MRERMQECLKHKRETEIEKEIDIAIQAKKERKKEEIRMRSIKRAEL